MPSPNPSAPDTVFVESKTESETESEIDFYECITDVESDPDQECPIQNQLGLPEYQNNFIKSSPPPVNVNVDANVELNNEGEFFFSMEGLKRLSFWLAEAACRVQDGQDEGIDSGVGANTDIVLSLDDKVRTTSSFWCCLQK